MEQGNPYLEPEWNLEKLTLELAENRCEWIDFCAKNAEIIELGDSIYEHRMWILQAIQHNLRPDYYD